MSIRSSRMVSLQVDVLEGRVALSSAAHALHVSHHAAQLAVGHTPVLVNLNPQQSGIVLTKASIDNRIGVIKLQGTVISPPAPSITLPPGFFNPSPTTLNVGISVTQALGRRDSITGGSSFTLNYTTNNTQVPFTILVTASQGTFAKGVADVSISAFTFSFNPNYAPALNAVVRLRPTHLY